MLGVLSEEVSEEEEDDDGEQTETDKQVKIPVENDHQNKKQIFKLIQQPNIYLNEFFLPSLNILGMRRAGRCGGATRHEARLWLRGPRVAQC